MIAPVMRRNSHRVFLWCITASVALHALLFAALPALVQDFKPLKAQPFDVVLRHPRPVSTVASETEKMPRAPIAVQSSRKTVEWRPPLQPQRVETPAPFPLAGEMPPAERAPSVKTNAPGLELKTDSKAVPHEPEPISSPVFNVAYLRNPSPQYPLAARRNGEEGTVMLKVLVTRDGTPASVGVERTSGSSRLDEAAAETVRTWRFVPARQGTRSVEAWVLVPIVFRLEGAS